MNIKQANKIINNYITNESRDPNGMDELSQALCVYRDGAVEHLISLTQLWAQDRNLILGSDSKSQLLKTMSELGELADGINKQRHNEIVDGIGDVMVTLIIIAAQNGLTIQECLEHAYNDIKDRKGRMIDGCFVKEGDL